MIPKALSEWTLPTFRSFLERGGLESDRFDLKEQLPNRGDPKRVVNTSKDLAAFANADGGFLVFGVTDDRNARVDDRLVGIDKSEDFFVQFGQLLNACEPSASWEPLNPPLELQNGRVIHVVHVLPSARRPHGVWDDDRWWFMKRTNRGNEVMSYEEVRVAFQDTENRRTKLALLVAEIEFIQSLADSVRDAIRENMNAALHDPAWLTQHPTTLLDAVLGDAFSLFAENADVWKKLSDVRQDARRANALAGAIATSITNGSRTGEDLDRKRHMQMQAQVCERLSMRCGEVAVALREVLRGRK